MKEWKPGREGDFNPYQAPSAEVGVEGTTREAVDGQPTPTLIEKLNGTGPWVLFLAVMGFIGAAFMALSGLSSLVMLPLMSRLGQGATGGGEMGVFIGLSLFYIGGGAAYALLAYLLVRYYQGISAATRQRTFESVEVALGAQSRFWRAAGVTTVAMILLTIVFTVSMFIFSAALAVL